MIRTHRTVTTTTHRRALRRRHTFGPRSVELMLLEDRTLLSTWSVTNTDDGLNPDGSLVANSLRWAIAQVNNDTSNPGVDEIDFAIPGPEVHTIRPTTPLPQVTHAVLIDGYSQGKSTPGDTTDDAVPNTQLDGDNAVLKIEIDGSGLSSIYLNALLEIYADGSTVQGLILNRFGSTVYHGGAELAVAAHHCVVAGNFIGTDSTGKVAMGPSSGVADFGAGDNLIGVDGTRPDALAMRNVISGNAWNGVWTGSGTVVAGNFIGTDATGTQPLGNGIGTNNQAAGVMVGGAGCRIGIDTTDPGAGRNFAAERNIISGNATVGVWVGGPPNAVIDGNYIGTDVSGLNPLGNIIGVAVSSGSYGVRIGTDGNNIHDDIEGNLIAGNGYQDVALGYGASGNVVAGNDIGTDVTGTRKLGSDEIGVYFQGSSTGNRVGVDGADADPAAERNIIDVTDYGVLMGGSDVTGNVVAGNYIGYDVSGVKGPGSHIGVQLYAGAHDNTIGGASTLERNLITGPLLIDGANGNVVAGNYIDVNLNGVVTGGLAGWQIGDVTGGIGISGGSQGNRIGTDGDSVFDANDDAGGNVIGLGGVSITGATTSGNLIAGNSIGTDAAGDPPTQDNGPVVRIVDSPGNTISGNRIASRNSIPNLNRPAVVVTDLIAGVTATGNTIRKNSIFAFALGGPGIDLNYDGVTRNDSHTGDPGPNNWQSFPMLSGAYAGPSPSPLVTGTLHSAPNKSFILDFYANAVPGPFLHGPGQRWLGWATVNTDPLGDVCDTNGNLGFIVPGLAPASPGEWISATATDLATATDPGGDTSEFSQDVQVSKAVTTTRVTASANPSFFGQPVTFTASITSPATVLGTPGGSVQFQVDGVNFGSPVPLSGGVTTVSTSTLPPGSRGIGALYSGDGSFATSGGGLLQSVRMLPTLTMLTFPGANPIAGLPTTITATVTAQPSFGVPTGTVTFYDGVDLLGTASLSASGGVATAILNTSAPAAGRHFVRAAYNGAFGFSSSSTLDGALTIVAGNGSSGNTGDGGPATAASVGYLTSIAIDGTDNLFLAQPSEGAIREVRTDGTITTVASGFNYPEEVAVDGAGNLFVADYGNGVIELHSDGTARTTVFAAPTDIWIQEPQIYLAVDSVGDLFVSYATGLADLIYKVTPGPGGKTTLFAEYDVDYFGPSPASIALDSAGNLYAFVADEARLFKVQGGTFALLANTPCCPSNEAIAGIAVNWAGDVLVPVFDGFVEVRPADGASARFLTTPSGALDLAADPAADSAGNVYLADSSHVYRFDMTPNLTVSPLQYTDVRTLLNNNQGAPVTLGATSTSSLVNILAAISNLPTNTTGELVVNLSNNASYRQQNSSGNTIPIVASAPSGTTLTILSSSGNATVYDLQASGGGIVHIRGTSDGTITIVGTSPALTVSSGHVTIGPRVTLVTATNAPTIVVNGGSLTVRNSTIQESTGFAQAALQVNGGTVDLGTAVDPGGNTLNVNGTGSLIQNNSGRSIPAFGDIFENKGVAMANAPSIYVLNPTASGALTVSNNASINIPGVVIVESTSPTALAIGSKAQLSAWASGVSLSMPDPLAGLTGPSVTDSTGHPLANYGSFVVGGNSKGSYTINPGIYSQINISGSVSLTMNPGIYIIEGGGLTVSGGASVTGTGVMIYNAGSNYPNAGGNFGGISLSGSGTFSLSAPASGYPGILIFQSRENTRALSISGSIMTGMYGTIYAKNALLSLSGGAQLQSMLDVGMLSVTGGAALTQMAAGSDGAGDTSGIANTLLAGDLAVYINDPSGYFSTDELARIQDAINAWDAILAPYNVTISEISDPSLANIVIDTGTTSACGGAADGVLGCFDAPNSEITMVQGWDWYVGADPSQIGGGQYDFETTMLHELGHALGLGHSANPSSPMYESLAAGVADRTVFTQDLNIPDPPQGADPQMAAGLKPKSPTGKLSLNRGVFTLNQRSTNIPTGLMALSSGGAAGNSSAANFVTPKAAGKPPRPVPSSEAASVSRLILQETTRAHDRRHSAADARTIRALDAALEELLAADHGMHRGA